MDVNVRDNDGWMPLHAAIHWGAKDVCETLAGAGASFDVRNNNVRAINVNPLMHIIS